MDLLQQISNLVTRLSGVESEFAKIQKQWKRIKDKDEATLTELCSGTYEAAIVPTFDPEGDFVKLDIHFSNRMVRQEKYVSGDEYSQIFKVNRRDLEYFVKDKNINPLNPADAATIKYHIKISKGVAKEQAALITGIHAAGVWLEGEFINLFNGDLS